MKNKNKGFTLIELVVVITILAILGTVGFMAINSYTAKAKASADISEAGNINNAIARAIADDKITVPASGTKTESYKSGDSAMTIGAGSGAGAGRENIVALGYLPMVPEIKSNIGGTAATRYWRVTISSTAQITVEVSNNSGSSKFDQLYPKPAAGFGQAPYNLLNP